MSGIKDLRLIKTEQYSAKLNEGIHGKGHEYIPLETAINAMCFIIEFRDPYTAKHQKEVTKLACSMAEIMGMDSKRITGLRMASLLHDIGKISIPAEILCKPAKLTGEEFALVKTHPLSGHNILKNIKTHMPLARIILEHHERLDGSGYPNGTTGDAILPESRILAVADVVNAIYSNRPYRPGQGIDTAIQEIKKNRGILYDHEAVDACVEILNTDIHFSEASNA